MEEAKEHIKSHKEFIAVIEATAQKNPSLSEECGELIEIEKALLKKEQEELKNALLGKKV